MSVIHSYHLKTENRDAVANAVQRLAGGRPALPVRSGERMPAGILVSPVREGWVSFWPMLEEGSDLLRDLTEALECYGVYFQATEETYWSVEVFHRGGSLGAFEQPWGQVEYDQLFGWTADSLEAEGISEPWQQEELFQQRMAEIHDSDEFQESLAAMRDERPDPAILEPLLPRHGNLARAVESLTAMDNREEDDPGSPFAEDYMQNFAEYLGIRDAAWDPRPDVEPLTRGDYEDTEGLPEGWDEFLVVPTSNLPLLG